MNEVKQKSTRTFFHFIMHNIDNELGKNNKKRDHI